MLQKIEMQSVTRRDFLALSGGGAVSVIASVLLPGVVRADAAKLAESMKKLVGDKPMKSGRISLELPQIAENGNTVPLAFEVESPMSDSDFVKSVHIFADKNPNPDVGSFHFSSASGRAKAGTRIRMRGSQNIVAVAEMSDGSIYMAKAPVKVTIGGCGG